MIERRVEKHVEAVQRELRVHAWNAPRLEAAFRELEGRRESDRALRERTARIGGAALALAAVVALVVVAWRAFAPGAEPSARATAWDASGFERLALGDGTEVGFERGARLDVRERTEARVIVSVRAGTAHFRVRHDPHRVFRVEAGDVAMEDLGTTFVVENKDGSVSVAVSEGSVSVSFPNRGGGRGSATLKAGERGVYPSGQRRAEANDVARASASDSAPPASGQTPESATPLRPAENWRELARAGKHRRAYELLSPGGFRDVSDDPSELLLASDVARLSHHPAEAVPLLRRLLARHERDSRAPSAAFTLGWVLMNELGRPREAALAFARAETLAPRGNLAEDAAARAVEAWYRAGELARAKAEVERYRTSYPQGRHLSMLQQLVGTP